MDELTPTTRAQHALLRERILLGWTLLKSTDSVIAHAISQLEIYVDYEEIP